MDLQVSDFVENILYLRLLKICGEDGSIDTGNWFLITKILYIDTDKTLRL
jgi:hypothetical protein